MKQLPLFDISWPQNFAWPSRGHLKNVNFVNSVSVHDLLLEWICHGLYNVNYSSMMTQSYDSLLRNYCRYAAIEQLHLSILVFLLVLLSANENLIKMANFFIFEIARFHPLIGQPIRIHTDWLSNRKGAQYLKMLKGISVCLLDTFLIVIYWIWKYFIYLDSFCTALFEYRYSRLLPYLLPRNFMVFDLRIMAPEVIQVLNAVVRGFQFR